MDKKGVIAYAFGVPASIWSNRMIAHIATTHARNDPAEKVFTQQDIQPGEAWKPFFEYIEEQPNQPPPTLRIARWAVKRCLEMGITQITIVGAQPHLWRCMRDTRMAAKELGADHLVIIEAMECCEWPEEKWFCKDSTQPRAQSKKNWEGRERILRQMPFFVYKRVAN